MFARPQREENAWNHEEVGLLLAEDIPDGLGEHVQSEDKASSKGGEGPASFNNQRLG